MVVRATSSLPFKCVFFPTDKKKLCSIVRSVNDTHSSALFENRYAHTQRHATHEKNVTIRDYMR